MRVGLRRGGAVLVCAPVSFNSLFEMPTLVVSEGLPHYERDDLSILYLRCQQRT